MEINLINIAEKVFKNPPLSAKTLETLEKRLFADLMPISRDTNGTIILAYVINCLIVN
jgi:hypothetical protein